MKKLLFFLATLFGFQAFAQHPTFFQSFLDEANERDTTYLFVSIEGGSLLSFEKPTPVLTKRSNGSLVLEDKEKKMRQELKGSMMIGIYPRRNVLGKYQPHAFFEVLGLETYLGSRFGVGLSNRDRRYSVGLMTGQYFRRRPEAADIYFRKLSLETGFIFGGYGYVDLEHLSCFVSIAKESKEVYQRIEISGKLARITRLDFVPEGIRFELFSESFLGTGPGLSYLTNDNKLRASLYHLTPENWEMEEQARMRNFIGEGIMIRLAYNWH